MNTLGKGMLWAEVDISVLIICKFSNEWTCTRKKDVEGLSCGFEENKNPQAFYFVLRSPCTTLLRQVRRRLGSAKEKNSFFLLHYTRLALTLHHVSKIYH